MGDVLSFRPRTLPRRPISAIHVEFRFPLAVVMSGDDLCPACKGRGLYSYKGKGKGVIIFDRCPCGGDDENRIDSPDFPGCA